MLDNTTGPFVQEIVGALESRGWLVPMVERQGKVTKVHFMHPLAHDGAFVGYTTRDLMTRSSAQMWDKLADDIVVAESIARLLPWPPCDDLKVPVRLCPPPPHLRAHG